jgi:hypothetical protein
MRWQRLWTRWIPALALAGIVGCGGEPPPDDPTTANAWTPAAASEDGEQAANRPPVIEVLRIEPREPVAGDRIRAVVSANEPDGEPVSVGYVWSIDDRTLTEGGAEIVLDETRRGARIAVVATASDGSNESEPARDEVTVRNRRPVLTGLKLDPAGAVPYGHLVVARPEARDPDGDALEFRYRWSVNGHALSEDGPSLDTSELSKGDTIQAQVWVGDGLDDGDPIYSQAVQIANSRPEIVSTPRGLDDDGVFRYEIEARDRDDHRNLRYYLSKGPKGMSVDPVLGAVSWRPTTSHAGVHTVELVVEDPDGATDMQTFELTIVSENPETASPAAMQ